MTACISNLAVPVSLLDTDLYKLTMQQAVFQTFLTTPASYHFTLRDKTVLFSKQCFESFRAAVAQFSSLVLTKSEQEWLKASCPYFTSDYLAYLAAFRYKPEQVRATFKPASDDGHLGYIDIDVVGPWVETILWEVPLMACLSESYFNTVVLDWTYDGQEELAFSKGCRLLEGDCDFMEFGTRRRRTYLAQDLVIKGLIRAAGNTQGAGHLVGTSNTHFAHKYGIKPVGTVAHEWFMGVGALKGYQNANSTALDLWESVYHDSLLVTLTDTFSSEVFYQSFVQQPERARRWHGLRQDSGDPFAFANRAKEMYGLLGIDVRDKLLIHSDGLNVDKTLRLKAHSGALGFKTCFGIGTYFTNDFRSTSNEPSKALNMVIKLSSVDGRKCAKISDELTKNTGDPDTIIEIKRIFNLTV